MTNAEMIQKLNAGINLLDNIHIAGLQNMQSVWNVAALMKEVGEELNKQDTTEEA